MVSDDPFFLSQLDGTFNTSYAHLTSAMQGYLRGWNHDCDKAVVVDKNRAWLHAVETLLHIEPDAKLIICLRDLTQIYGSIEAQHQRTILIDFVDHLADYDRFGRADMLFAKDKAIGAPLLSLNAVPDLPRHVQEHLFFVRFEDLMAQPVSCMAQLYAWLGVEPFNIDAGHLPVGVQESDSHYHMKYRHTQSGTLQAPKLHEVSPRIQSLIETAYAWYYQLYYPQQKK